MNDVVINKVQSIQRCVRRAREEYHSGSGDFSTNHTRQDAALLNVLRACETAINLANHVIRIRRLGIPVSSADSFNLLQSEGIIEAGPAARLGKMVAFRNLVVHQYAKLDINIVESVITADLDELLAFADRIRGFFDGVA